VSEFGPGPVFAPVTVTLDGSASLDPDGNPITFQWTQTAGPAASLSNPNAMQPTFTVPQVPRTPSSTVLSFQLVVNDGIQSSAPSFVNITVLNVNRPPTANAGPPQTVNALTTVTLNGNGSSDPDTGDVLTYAWSQTAGPAVTLSSATAASPTFTAPLVTGDTTLTFRLIVNDGAVASGPSTVNILVQFAKAAAGPNDFYTVTPCRLIDTRLAAGPLGGPSLGPSESRTFNLAGACGIPITAVSISVNVTAVGPTTAGYLRILASDAGPSSTSVLNFGAGQTRANNALLTISNDILGGVTVTNGSSGTVDVVIDVNGYLQ